MAMLYDPYAMHGTSPSEFSRVWLVEEPDVTLARHARVIAELDFSSTEKTKRRNQQKFERLAKEWLEETMFISSPAEKYLHPSYARIIGMGMEAVPLILHQLEKRTGDWFYALRAITGENPVTSDIAGNMPKMRDMWLAWGRGRKLLDGTTTKTPKEDSSVSKLGEEKQRRYKRLRS
jgi:hypothetical protein